MPELGDFDLTPRPAPPRDRSVAALQLAVAVAWLLAAAYWIGHLITAL